MHLYLLDFNNILRRHAAAHSTLSYQGDFTGALYGVYNFLCNVVTTFGPGRFVVCHDRRPYLRNSMFSGYKERRSREPDVAWVESLQQAEFQLDMLFDELHLQRVEVEGFEADDLIALMHIWHGHKFEHGTVALSNDSDLNQLLEQDRFAIFKAGKQKNNRVRNLYTEAHFLRDFPTLESPRQWVYVVALTGSHNDVPGIKGIGPKSACDIVANQRRSRYWAIAQSNREMVRRNRELIALPLPTWEDYVFGTIELENTPVKPDSRPVVRFLSKYGIQVPVYNAERIETIIKHAQGD